MKQEEKEMRRFAFALPLSTSSSSDDSVGGESDLIFDDSNWQDYSFSSSSFSLHSLLSCPTPGIQEEKKDDNDDDDDERGVKQIKRKGNLNQTSDTT